jgi:signal transduction histidine kinase
VLQATLLHLLMNAEEAIKTRGTVQVSAATVPGRAMTVAEAEALGEGQEVARGHSEGKRAWLSDAPRVELSISDDGCGIPEENQARLFTPFFTTKSSHPGTLGLGLPAVADALARHGGSIRVDSKEGEGSTFVLELPCVSPPSRTSGRRARS